MIKILSLMAIEGTYLNVVKAIYDNSKANIRCIEQNKHILSGSFNSHIKYKIFYAGMVAGRLDRGKCWGFGLKWLYMDYKK